MPDWSVYLTDKNGVRLADLNDNFGFEFTRVANAVGSFSIDLPPTFDDELLSKDSRIEIYRNFEGKSKLMFCGLVNEWELTGTVDAKTVIGGRCINHLLKRRVILPPTGELGGSYMFAGTQTNDVFYISDDHGATWTNTGTPGMTTGGVYGSVLAADGSLVIASGSNTGGELGKIHRSTNNGDTWTLVHTEANDRYVFSICRVPSTGTLIATTGTADGRMLRSTNHGATWAVVHNTVGDWLTDSVVAANGDILVGAQVDFVNDPELWRSQDDGQNWSNIGALTGSGDYVIQAMYRLRNGDLLIGTGPTWGEIWRSTNDGASWTRMVALQTPTNSDYVYDFIELPSGLILAGTRQDARIFGSRNGASWWQIAELAAGGGGVSVFSFAPLNNGEVLAATDNSGKVYRSSNRGLSWTELSDTGETTVRTICKATQ